MKRTIGLALGAVMLTSLGLGLGAAQAGVIGPVSSEGVAGTDATIIKAQWGHGWGQ